MPQFSPRDVIERFRNNKVLVIGDVMVDRYVYGSVDRISPEAPVPVLLFEKEERKLGGAANVALNLKTLGADVGVCGVVKGDENGRWLNRRLIYEDIMNECIGTHGSFCRYQASVQGHTTTKTRIVTGNQQVCRIDREPPCIESGQKRVILDFSGYDAIFVSDYGKGAVTDDILCQVRSSGIPFYCDPKGPNLSRYAGAWGITPNKKEALAFKFPFPSQSPHYNLTNLNIRTCMITRGKGGVHWWDRETGDIVYQLDAYRRELADACGAGDTAFAVYGLSKMSGAMTGTAAGLANLAGSLVCEHFGVVPITWTELIAALSEGE